MGKLILTLSVALALVGCGKGAEDQAKDDARDGNRLVEQYNNVEAPKLRNMLTSSVTADFLKLKEKNLSNDEIRSRISHGKALLHQLEVCQSLARGITKFANKDNVRYGGDLSDLNKQIKMMEDLKQTFQESIKVYEAKLN